jgi:RimJ/RimL family protein N-acetyltransferase
MITGEHAVIRTADPDDARSLLRLYDTTRPVAFILGPSREVSVPTLDELQETLARREIATGSFYVVENREGAIRGCCAVRGIAKETVHAEMALALVDDTDYEAPLAQEALEFLCHSAFVEKKLAKVMAHCLDTEHAYRQLLVRNQFESAGTQRDMVYACGRYYNLESLRLVSTNHREETRESES